MTAQPGNQSVSDSTMDFTTSAPGVTPQPVITDAPVRLPGAVAYKSALKSSGPLQSALKKTVLEESCDDSDASSLRTVDDSDGSKSLTSCESSPSKSTKSNRHVSFSASPSVYPIENLSEYNVYDPPSCFSRSGSCGERLKYFGGIDCKSFASPPAYVGSHADAPSAQVCKIVDPQPQLCIKSKAIITSTPLTCTVDAARKVRDGDIVNNSIGSNTSEVFNEEFDLGDSRCYSGDINKTAGRSCSSISKPHTSLFKNPVSEQTPDLNDVPESRISQIKERLSRKVSPKLPTENVLYSPRMSGRIFTYDVDSSKLPSSPPYSGHFGPGALKSSENSFVNSEPTSTSGVATAMSKGSVSPTKITTPASIISSRGAIAALAKSSKTKTVKVIPIASRIKIEAPKIKTSPTSPKTSPTDSSGANLPKVCEFVSSSTQPTSNNQVKNLESMRRSSDFDDLSTSGGREENSMESIRAQASAVALDIAGAATSESSCISNVSSPSIDSIDTLLSKVHVNLEENDGTFGLCPNSEPSISNDVSMESIQQVSLSEELEGTNVKNAIGEETQKPKKYLGSHYIISEESDVLEETQTRVQATPHVDASVDNEQFCVTSESNGNKENNSATNNGCPTQTSLNNVDVHLPAPRQLSYLRPGNNLLSSQGKRPGSLDSNDEGSDQSHSEAYVEAMSPSEAFDVNLRCSVGDRLSLSHLDSNRVSSFTSIPAFYDERSTKTAVTRTPKFNHQQDSEDDVSEESFCSASPGEEKIPVGDRMSILDIESDSVPSDQVGMSTEEKTNRRVNLKIQLSSSDTTNTFSVVDTQKIPENLCLKTKCAETLRNGSKEIKSVNGFEKDTLSSVAGGVQLAGGGIEICGDLDISESPSSISHSSKIASIKNELLQADSTDASEECSTASGQVVSDGESSLSELSGSLRNDDDDAARRSSKVSNIVSMFSEGTSGKEMPTSERTISRSKPKTVRLRTSIPIASISSNADVTTTKSGLGCVNTPGNNSSLLRYKKRNAFSSRKAMFEKLEKSSAAHPLTEPQSLKTTSTRKERTNPSSSQKVEILNAGGSSGSSALGSFGDSDVSKSSFSCASSVKTSSTDSEVAIAENFHPKLRKHKKKSDTFEISSEAEKRSSSHCDYDRESPRTTASFDSEMGSLSSISSTTEQDAVRSRATSQTLGGVDRGKPVTSRLPLTKKHCDNSAMQASKIEKAPKANIGAGKIKTESKLSLKPSNISQKTSPRLRRKDKPTQSFDEKRNSSSESSLCESSISESYDRGKGKQQVSSIPCHSKFVSKTEKDCSASAVRLRETKISTDTSSTESTLHKSSREISIQNRSIPAKKTSSCARFATSSSNKRATTNSSKPYESKSLKMSPSNKLRCSNQADEAAVTDNVNQVSDRKSYGSTRLIHHEDNIKTQSSGGIEERLLSKISNDSPKMNEFESCTLTETPGMSSRDVDSNLKSDEASASSKKSVELAGSVSDPSEDCELKQLIEHLEKEHDELEHRSRVVAAAALRKKNSSSKSRKIPRVQKLISQFETK